MKTKCLLLIVLLSIGFGELSAQSSKFKNFITASDTLNKQRFIGLNVGITTTFTGVFVGLNELWYKGYDKAPFHWYNDIGEWENMDKYGHLFSAYSLVEYTQVGFRWAGVERRKAVWAGALCSTLFQGSIELLDGYSAAWGASWPDLAYNTAGVALYTSQELMWEEQRIILKYSSHRTPYNNDPIYAADGFNFSSNEARAFDLYGNSFFEIMLKDYNSSTYWFSANIHSFLPKKEDSKFPKWLNVAVGYGAENMYGGYGNSWSDNLGNAYVADPVLYPRYRQYFLSLDVDFDRIQSKRKIWKYVFYVVNALKFPAPTLELSQGKLKFHPIYF